MTFEQAIEGQINQINYIKIESEYPNLDDTKSNNQRKEHQGPETRREKR